MKIRKNYTLYINEMLGTATFGNRKFSDRINDATIGKIFDCDFSELKYNLKILTQRGYNVAQTKR